jgi:hypothetical protein
MVLYNDIVFDQLEQHINHSLVVAAYGPNSRIDNIAVECEDCNVVLHDVEPDMNEPEY